MAMENTVHMIDSKETWNAKLQEGILRKKTIVVDFTATWCGPCRLIAPAYEDLSKKYTNLIFVKVDVDELQEISSEWEVRAMPTFLFIKDGKLVDKFVGASKEELEKKVEGFGREVLTMEFADSKIHNAHHGRLAHIQT